MTAPPREPVAWRDSPCVEFDGNINDRGYGRIFISRHKSIRAHVAAWEAVNGPVDKGMVLDHLCRNRACVNVAHLEMITPRENTLRGNGPSAKNAKKSHCVNGHEFAGDNLHVNRDGSRACNACWRINDARYKAKRKERAALGSVK